MIILHFVSLCVLCLEIRKLEPSETPLIIKHQHGHFGLVSFNIIMSLELIPFRYVSPDGTNAMIIQTAFHASKSFLLFSLTPAFTRGSRTKPNFLLTITSHLFSWTMRSSLIPYWLGCSWLADTLILKGRVK